MFLTSRYPVHYILIGFSEVVKIISFIFNLHYYNDAKIFILATHELDVYMNMNPYKT